MVANEDGEEGEAQKVVVVHKDILPNAVFVLEGKDEELVKRVRELSEEQLKSAGITQDRMEARLKY